MTSASDSNPVRVNIIGAAHLDRVGRLDRQASDGASVPGRFKEMPGGAALNVASNLAAFGVPALLSSIVGDDPSGKAVRQALEERGIEPHLQAGAGQTASYTAILQPDGELLIALADMDIYEEFGTQLTTVSTIGSGRDNWLVVDANLNENALKELIRAAKTARGKPRIAALSVSTAKAPRLRGCLGSIDVLFTNRREALALSRGDVTGTMDEAVQGLQHLEVARAVISDGANSVIVLNGGEKIEIPVTGSVPPVIKDVTGAGDALAAGTLARLIRDTPLTSLPSAVHTGLAAAGAILQVEGPWRSDLVEAMEAIPATDNQTAPR